MIFDGRDLRNALGQFATGVCVITTVTPDQRALGITANSFSSVSLDPPLVLWSLQNNSDIYNEFCNPGNFAINVLAKDQQAHSNKYASKGAHELDPAHHRLGAHGSPVLHNVLASFECELETTHSGGDHLIILGRVLGMSSRSDGEPLLFHAGAYRQLS